MVQTPKCEYVALVRVNIIKKDEYKICRKIIRKKNKHKIRVFLLISLGKTNTRYVA